MGTPRMQPRGSKVSVTFSQHLLLYRSWVLVSWIWSLIWHMPLDLIKWIMAYILNEDGFRSKIHGKKPTNIATETANVDLPPQVRLPLPLGNPNGSCVDLAFR